MKKAVIRELKYVARKLPNTWVVVNTKQFVSSKSDAAHRHLPKDEIKKMKPGQTYTLTIPKLIPVVGDEH